MPWWLSTGALILFILTDFTYFFAWQITLDEFLNVDLVAMTDEMDPPSFKAARRKDKELLERLQSEDISREFSELEEKIEKELDERRRRKKG